MWQRKAINQIKKKLLPANDFIFRDIIISNQRIFIIYNESLSDGKNLLKLFLYKLSELKRTELHHLNKKIPECILIKKNEIISYLHLGYCIIISNKIYAFEIKANLERNISMIESELSYFGPKDSFTESYLNNLGLIRKRIKSSSLKYDELSLGLYTKTRCAVLYIDSICKKEIIDEILSKLKRIHIDGIIDSSYIKSVFEERFQLFPTLIMTERPDKCSMALLEGKAVIIVENSPYAIILPSFFFDFFHTTDDYYQKPFNTSFIRIIRFIAFLIALLTPGLYIAITTRNYDLVPLPLLLMLKAGRSFVPFPAYLEALFMIICFEILKESDFRMSSTSGSAISILGGLILGDAAVAAGIVSPIMIIIIAISSIAGLIFPSIELGNTIRFYKLIFLFLGSALGIYGIFLGLVLMIHHMMEIRIFHLRYLNIDKYEVLDSLIKINPRIRKRNSTLTDNKIRGKYL